MPLGTNFLNGVERSKLIAEGLKAKATGKNSSAKPMSTVGVWEFSNILYQVQKRGNRNGSVVNAAVKFIEKWN